jgi:pilus assembly protein CpaD
MSSPANSRPSGRPILAAVLASGLALALGGCGGMGDNQSLDSVHQPVVEHAQYQLDLTASPRGIQPAETARLDDWLSTMNLRYGDHIGLDDPLASPATRVAIEAVVAHYGLLVSPQVPVTQGTVNGGTVRVVVTRAVASVPHCPDWKANSETNFMNSTSSNYGCSVNSNLAAMVANPDDLLHGQRGASGTSSTVNDRAFGAYLNKAPTGAGDVKANATK